MGNDRETLQQLLGILEPLEEQERLRQLRTVLTFYDIKIEQEYSAKDSLGAAYRIDGPTDQTPSSASVARAPTFSGHEELSPKAFIFEKNPRTDVARVACLSYYLTHYRDTPHFKTSDVSKLNTEAAQRKFSNAAYFVKNATTSGYLVPAPNKLKQLSAMGEKYVEALPDAAAARAVQAKFRPRRTRTKGTAQKNS